MKYLIFFLLLSLLIPNVLVSQRITYTEPERDDSKSTDFEIIGKIKGNYLVYKGNRSTHTVSAYDSDLKLKEKTNLSFLPERVIDAEFVCYSDFSYMIYEYQRRNTLHCMAVTLDSLGRAVGQPRELDTTSVSIFSDNKIYNLSVSEDKQKITIYKIQRKNDKFYYTTILLNNRLELQRKSRMLLSYDDRRNTLSDFFTDNDGDFVFALGHKATLKDYIDEVSLMVKSPQSDTFTYHDIDLQKLYLDQLLLKVDNVNKRYLISSFYYNKKRGDIAGLYAAIWDGNKNIQTGNNANPFSDTLKKDARSEGPVKMAFNNFFIRDIILKRDGGFIVAGEDYYTQSRTTPWNRMDYLYGYPYSSYDYYNPTFYNPYRYRYPSYYGGNNLNPTRYFYDNIMVVNLDNTGKLQWNNIIHKKQYDDDTDNFLSFEVFNAGNQLHFIYNEKDRRNEMLTDLSVTPQGEVIRNPTLKSLDRGYDFMPRLGKQVSSREVIVPCYYRNYLCFARIDY